jgi:ubiquinone/menaquinone biosynthesis C-methylase UbiE
MAKAVHEVRDDFDHVARIAEQFRAGSDGSPQPHERYLLRYLPQPCDSVLELGCGTGEFSRRLAARAARVVALDLSPEMIRVARDRSRHCGNIEFVIADMTSLPLRGARFDCVASLNTLHHVDPVLALQAMRGALRPGGTLLLADILDRSGARHLPINLVASIVRLVRSAVLERRTQRGALHAAYRRHGCGESHPTLAEVRSLVAAELPGAVVRGHLLWRYTVVWRASR